MVLMFDVLVGATFSIGCCCTGDPTTFTLVIAPLITVTMIVSMFRTIMDYLEPFMSIRVPLHDTFIRQV